MALLTFEGSVKLRSCVHILIKSKQKASQKFMNVLFIVTSKLVEELSQGCLKIILRSLELTQVAGSPLIDGLLVSVKKLAKGYRYLAFV